MCVRTKGLVPGVRCSVCSNMRKRSACSNMFLVLFSKITFSWCCSLINRSCVSGALDTNTQNMSFCPNNWNMFEHPLHRTLGSYILRCRAARMSNARVFSLEHGSSCCCSSPVLFFISELWCPLSMKKALVGVIGIRRQI